MDKLIIEGGIPLKGLVRLGGAKNASFKLMIASLLGENESRLLNFSHIIDVDITADIISNLGGKITRRGERTIFVDPKQLQRHEIDKKYGPLSRSAPLFIPALLARFSQAKVPLPGGDKIGKRPLNRHWDGLKKMGAKIIQKNGLIEVKAKKLKGIKYRFDKNTHTGTEFLIMAAVKAKGKTILENAALEPEVDDMIFFLNSMGANIRRRHGRTIEVIGTNRLNGTIHKIMPDRNEAVSYACAAIATGGDIIVENANYKHLEAFLDKLDEMGAGFEVGNYGIRFYYKKGLRPVDVVTSPHPGFMTDWQPLWATLLTQVKGTSIIHEAVFPSRFQYVKHLNLMGAKVEFFNPKVKNPSKYYNFDLENDSENDFRAIRIKGKTKLKAGSFAVKDLRHGATLVVASMIASGKSVIENVDQIDRGYEDLDGRLKSMGAKIERINGK